MNMATNFLPIGSVVLLKNGNKNLMITGFYTIPEESPEEVYDYCGCLYPEGVISSDEIYVFDHDQIQDVLFIGFENREQREFKERLIEGVKKIEDMPNQEEVPESNNKEEIERL